MGETVAGVGDTLYCATTLAVVLVMVTAPPLASMGTKSIPKALPQQTT